MDDKKAREAIEMVESEAQTQDSELLGEE